MLATDAHTIREGDARLECSMVSWDSDAFGFPVAQISDLELGQGAVNGEMFVMFEDWCARHEVRLVSCRLHHDQIRESIALEDHGFRFIEMVYLPRMSSLTEVPAPRDVIRVARAVERDLLELEEVAYSAFTTGRYEIDPRLPPELSRRRYARWVGTSFHNGHHEVLKAEMGGELVGLFILEHRPDTSVYWHLTAVADGWRGKGIGTSLWQAMLARHRDEGASFVETTISGHNLPAINLYSSLGFRFPSAQMTLHWLRTPGD